MPTTKSLNITPEVSAVLSKATLAGDSLYLGPETLPRPLYLATNKIIESLGGKWDKKRKCHVFIGDGLNALQDFLSAGKVVVDVFGYFPTPEPLARQLIEMAGIQASHSVLEPSAGQGHIARLIQEITRNIQCVEIQRDNCDVLETLGLRYDHADFLQCSPLSLSERFDCVVMNPPFEQQQDIEHVMHAFKFLKKGGRLATIMSSTVMNSNSKKALAFQQFFYDHSGTFCMNPAHSFKESGTAVSTIRLLLKR